MCLIPDEQFTFGFNFYWFFEINCWNLRCPVCDDDKESQTHLFIKSKVARELWRGIDKWWKSNLQTCTDVHSIMSYADHSSCNSLCKAALDVVIQTSIWVLWPYRNEIIFNLKKTKEWNKLWRCPTLDVYLDIQ